jgi:hypothetical protein
MMEFAGALLRQSLLILIVPQFTQRLLWDSRVVALTRSYNPIFASCIILSVLIFQGQINAWSVADAQWSIRP